VFCEKINISPTCSPDKKTNGLCKTNNISPTCSPDEKINGQCKAEVHSAATTNSSFSNDSFAKDPYTTKRKTTPILSPSDLPPAQIFTDWDPPTNSTISLPLKSKQIIAKGSVRQRKNIDKSEKSFPPRLSVLQEVLPRETVAEIISLLRFGNVSTDSRLDEMYDGKPAVKLDNDPDSVDAMVSQEFVLSSTALSRGLPSKDFNTVEEEHTGERAYIRQQVRKRLDPILEGIITPFVRSHFPEQCSNKGKGRNCTACYSMIRRYRVGERKSHATHQDGQSLATVVVSLSDYNREYTGGLYVATEFSNRMYIALNRGDAVVHQSDLYHGVEVLENKHKKEKKNFVPERWSWIMWYRDSESCEENHGPEWFQSCADKGNPNCQSLLAQHNSDTPEIMYHWFERACDNGQAEACVRLGRTYLKLAHSNHHFDPMKAQTLYQRAIKLSHHPDAFYVLASMVLAFISSYNDGGSPLWEKEKNVVKGDDHRIIKVIQYLEGAAKGGHVLAMFNLGIAHFYGYGYPNGTKNYHLAAEWWEESGTPEGYAALAMYFESLGKPIKAKKFEKRATVLGYGSYWRQKLREMYQAGTFGINLPWPPLGNSENVPPEW